MKKQKTVYVKWNGPDGLINPSNNDDLFELFDNSVLKKYYIDNNTVPQKDFDKVRLTVQEALKYSRKIFGAYDLVSSYHNFAHNYVTSVTAFKAFIGALKLQEKLTINDLKNLLVVSLFHDTGYLQKSEFRGKANVVTHIIRSLNFLNNFVRDLKWEQKDVKKVLKLGEFTNYSEWEVNKKELSKSTVSTEKLSRSGILLAQILVGADLMQVVDVNYFDNLKILTEFLGTNSTRNGKEDQKRFFDLSCELTQWIWKYLDAFYGSKSKNPYRKGWKRFKAGIEKRFGINTLNNSN